VAYGLYPQAGEAIKALCSISLFNLKTSFLFQKINKSKKEKICESDCWRKWKQNKSVWVV